MSTKARIEHLIAEREQLNNRLKTAMDNNKTPVENGILNFTTFINDWQKHLSEMLINEEIIGVLSELKMGYSTSFAEKAIANIKAKMDLLDNQIKGLEETRSQLRRLNLWEGDTVGLLNKELILTKYKHQVYFQATVDIDTIIDFI